MANQLVSYSNSTSLGSQPGNASSTQGESSQQQSKNPGPQHDECYVDVRGLLHEDLVCGNINTKGCRTVFIDARGCANCRIYGPLHATACTKVIIDLRNSSNCKIGGVLSSHSNCAVCIDMRSCSNCDVVGKLSVHPDSPVSIDMRSCANCDIRGPVCSSQRSERCDVTVDMRFSANCDVDVGVNSQTTVHSAGCSNCNPQGPCRRPHPPHESAYEYDLGEYHQSSSGRRGGAYESEHRPSHRSRRHPSTRDAVFNSYTSNVIINGGLTVNDNHFTDQSSRPRNDNGTHDSSRVTELPSEPRAPGRNSTAGHSRPGISGTTQAGSSYQASRQNHRPPPTSGHRGPQIPPRPAAPRAAGTTQQAPSNNATAARKRSRPDAVVESNENDSAVRATPPPCGTLQANQK